MAWFVSVAALGDWASAADEAAGPMAGESVNATSAALPLSVLVMLVVAAVLGAVACRRRWLTLDGRPGLNWFASPMQLMVMCVVTWLAGAMSTLVAARALGLGGALDPASLTVRQTAIVTAAAMGAGLLAAIGLIVWMGRIQLVPRAATPWARSIALGVVALVAWWPAIASAGWIGGKLQFMATGIEPPAIGHSTLEQMVQGTRDGWWWLMGLSAVVLAPILEECLYRGFVQQALRRAGLGPWPAVLIASAVFTLMHVGSVPEGARAASLTSLAVLSCCFGWLAERTGSLVAPVAAHVAFNLGNLMVATAFA